MRDIANVVAHLYNEIKDNADITTELFRALKDLQTRCAWAAPEITVMLWQELGQLMARHFPESHPRARMYRAIFTGLGNKTVVAPSVNAPANVQPSLLTAERALHELEYTCGGILSRMLSIDSLDCIRRMITVLENEDPGCLVRVMEARRLPVGETGPTTAEEAEAVRLAERVLATREGHRGEPGPSDSTFVACTNLKRPGSCEGCLNHLPIKMAGPRPGEIMGVTGDTGPTTPAEEAQRERESAVPKTITMVAPDGTTIVLHQVLTGPCGDAGPVDTEKLGSQDRSSTGLTDVVGLGSTAPTLARPINIRKLTEPGTKRPLGSVVAELRSTMELNGDLTSAIADVLTYIECFKINDSVPSPAANGCLWVQLSKVVSCFSASDPHKAQYLAILDSAQ
jgi:hypothetical protein